jgi:UDP-glucose 4-epimerase
MNFLLDVNASGIVAHWLIQRGHDVAEVGESVHKPDKYYRKNVVGSFTLLESMIKHRVHRIVFSSTCSAYGDPLSLPISEDHIQNPVNHYGQSKLIIEKMLRDKI